MNEMDPKVYAAKKMSRYELENKDMSEEVSSDEDIDEDDFEEGEDEFEEGEDEFVEVSKSKQKISSESDDDILSEK